jgi:transaldolase
MTSDPLTKRYDEVMAAFLAGLERARRAGHDLSHIASVASFFVSRVDTEVGTRLDKIGTAEAARLLGRRGTHVRRQLAAAERATGRHPGAAVARQRGGVT